jgi:uncharacterized Zn-binding protein involved in type VI secretion
MGGITVKGKDSAGGVQLAGQQSAWLVEGAAIVLKGDPVAGHGQAPHSGPVMAQGSGWMTLNGVPVVRAGHVATCGHAATGRGWFDIE